MREEGGGEKTDGCVCEDRTADRTRRLGAAACARAAASQPARPVESPGRPTAHAPSLLSPCLPAAASVAFTTSATTLAGQRISRVSAWWGELTSRAMRRVMVVLPWGLVSAGASVPWKRALERRMRSTLEPWGEWTRPSVGQRTTRRRKGGGLAGWLAGWTRKDGGALGCVCVCVHERTRAPRDACPPACPPHRGEAWRRTAYEAILARRGSAGGDPPWAGEASGEDGPPPPSRPAADGLGCIGGTPPAVVPAGPSDGRGPAGEGGAGDDDGEGTPDDEAPAPRQLPRLGPGGRGSREGGQAAGRQDPCLRDGI